MERLGEALAALNAALNGTSALLAFLGWRAIKARRIALHRTLMLSAVTCSVLFLVSYLTRLALTGVHRFVGPPGLTLGYKLLLLSHTMLAVVVVPLVARVVYLAWKGRFEEHARLARKTLPAWLYVSVTGVIVYFMLYHVSAS